MTCCEAMSAVNITRDILHRQIRDKRALGFQRQYHVTDPFINRLGLEAELQFLPHSGDRILVTGAADTKVHVHDVSVKETIHMFSDHTNRVKRIATAPMWPNTFWSAAEDGIIRQYDLRESSKRSEVLIDLTEYCGQLVEAKKSASQSTSAGVHTFCDRQKPIPDGAGQYYVAGHLPVKLPDYNNRLRVLVATYVTFSPDGTELLVNMGGEQVYLFDLTFKQKPYTYLLPKNSGDLPPHLERIKQQANDAFARQQWTQAIQLYSLGIHEASHNAMLYGNRAAAYMKRKWDGDHYDALRDCLKALSLNPGHLKAHFRLARCLFELKYVAEALECLDDFKGKFPEQAHSSACDALDKDIKAALFSKMDSAEDKKGNSSIRFHTFSRKEPIPEDEVVLRERSYDYKHRYCGHCNTTTDIKEANFFGSYCFLATSGIDPVVRLWNPRPETESESGNGRVVEDMEGAAAANQRRMNADPLEVMLLNMGYRITGLSGRGPEGSDDEDSSDGQVQCRPS
ncbi:unnamed protein product [Coregonus sp. 'balchen']|nr:unnamed protein product [Coregonus sp. 'balchen']